MRGENVEILGRAEHQELREGGPRPGVGARVEGRTNASTVPPTLKAASGLSTGVVALSRLTVAALAVILPHGLSSSPGDGNSCGSGEAAGAAASSARWHSAEAMGIRS